MASQLQFTGQRQAAPAPLFFEKGLEMKATERDPKIEKAVTDPVCGMRVTQDDAEATTEYKGKTYYFCSVGCKDRFKTNPKQYENRAKSE
jgi:YHS domain-containing protein